jgi:predicted RNA-binding Zn ribbon-like protein
VPKAKSKPFQLLAGHPALDFVNTLDNRFVDSGTIELMADYGDLLRFMQQSRLLDTSKVRQLARCHAATAASLMQQVHALREALATVFYSSSEPLRASALQIIQPFAMQASVNRRLERAEGRSADGVAHWRWATADYGLPLWVLANIAQSLLTGKDSRRVRACGRESCKWLFLDASKNHSRRWCDMQVCGNRVKAQRYKAAHLA